jgi:hypothetical protein
MGIMWHCVKSFIWCFREANANIILGPRCLNFPFYAETYLACGLRGAVGPPRGFADLQGFLRSELQVQVLQRLKNILFVYKLSQSFLILTLTK